MRTRFIDSGSRSAAMNMAIDEALMASASEEAVLRFYSWKPAAVSLGFFQSAEQELDLKECEKQGVDVVRRLTGGGAVFHDSELTYTIIMPESAAPQDILESYNFICGALISALESLDIPAEFRAVNDVVVNGKKISGNAQTRRDGILLQHGTILLDVDVERMFSLLNVPDEKFRDKGIKSAKDGLTSITAELGDFSLNAFKEALKEGFSGLGLELRDSELSEGEQRRARKLISKYSNREWNKQ